MTQAKDDISAAQHNYAHMLILALARANDVIAEQQQALEALRNELEGLQESVETPLITIEPKDASETKLWALTTAFLKRFEPGDKVVSAALVPRKEPVMIYEMPEFQALFAYTCDNVAATGYKSSEYLTRSFEWGGATVFGGGGGGGTDPGKTETYGGGRASGQVDMD